MSQRTPQTGIRNPEPPDSGFPFRIPGLRGVGGRTSNNSDWSTQMNPEWHPKSGFETGIRSRNRNPEGTCPGFRISGPPAWAGGGQSVQEVFRVVSVLGSAWAAGGQSAQEVLRVASALEGLRVASVLGRPWAPDLSQRTPQTGIRSPEPPDPGFPFRIPDWGVSGAEPQTTSTRTPK